GSNAEPGSPMQIDALATSVANGDGTYTVTSPTAIPSEVTGSGTAVLEGHPAIPDPSAPGRFLRVPVINAVTYFGITDATPQPRRQVVSVENCNVCHRQLTAHGSNRTGNTDVCPVCHNPNATDLAFRSEYVPGEEQAIDFKVMIHEVHGEKIRNTPVVITGFRGSQNEFPLPFPGDVANCKICHVQSTYALPLQPFVLDTTIDSKGNNDPADNTRRPKQAAVCTSCHDTVQFSGTAPACTGPNQPSPCLHSAGAVGENADCAVCHVAGQPGDVTRVHRIQQ
ncbi:MAG: multiheme c-type cytochrome, partial [Myxococcaceae bacterium]